MLREAILVMHWSTLAAGPGQVWMAKRCNLANICQVDIAVCCTEIASVVEAANGSST